jgi:hypothetical protein
MHMIVISNVDSTYVSFICGQYMIIWHTTFLPAGVSMVDTIVPYVWRTLMHSGYSTARKSLFYCHRRFLPLNHPFRCNKWSFLKGKTARKGPPKRKLGVDIKKCSMILNHQKMIGSKGMEKITTGLIYVAFVNSLMHQH